MEKNYDLEKQQHHIFHIVVCHLILSSGHGLNYSYFALEVSQKTKWNFDKTNNVDYCH